LATLAPGRIRHSAVFTLVHAAGTDGETRFLEAIAELRDLPSVEAFEVLREVSPKNGYRFVVSMEFADEDAYQAYNDHPEHVAFVRERWDAEVTDFIEIDTVARTPEDGLADA
jgi:hypothetical protein